MGRLFGPILVLAIQVLGLLLLGCWLLLTPARAGNQLHDAFLVFPPVSQRDWIKKLFLRSLGAGLIAIAINAALEFLKVIGALKAH
jgi:hypothetical protein